MNGLMFFLGFYLFFGLRIGVRLQNRRESWGMRKIRKATERTGRTKGVGETGEMALPCRASVR